MGRGRIEGTDFRRVESLMPSRMEEIAARSAKSPDEYKANKARNDALAASYRKEKKSDDSKRKSVLRKTIPGLSAGAAMRSTVITETRGTVVPNNVVLKPVPAPVVVSEPPVDMIDYSVSPQSMEVPWSRLPAAGMLAGLSVPVGTMMVMLGKRMLVSMAVTGLQFAAMEPLQQYGKGLPRATVLWHTGRSAGEGKRVTRVRGTGAGGFYVAPPGEEDDPLALAKDALAFGSDVSDWVSEQVRTYFGFGGWLD